MSKVKNENQEKLTNTVKQVLINTNDAIDQLKNMQSNMQNGMDKVANGIEKELGRYLNYHNQLKVVKNQVATLKKNQH